MVSEFTVTNAMEWRIAGQDPLTSARVCSVHVRVADSRIQKSSLAASSAASKGHMRMRTALRAHQCTSRRCTRALFMEAEILKSQCSRTWALCAAPWRAPSPRWQAVTTKATKHICPISPGVRHRKPHIRSGWRTRIPRNDFNHAEKAVGVRQLPALCDSPGDWDGAGGRELEQHGEQHVHQTTRCVKGGEIPL
jgi:hypothetical protein